MENVGKLPKGVHRKTAKGRTYHYFVYEDALGRRKHRPLPAPTSTQFTHEYAVALAESLGAEIPEWRRPAAPVFVYFIGGEEGPIKIGMAVRPDARLKEIQVGYPYKLRILATCAGGQKQERAYHRHFAAHRLSGEWFTRCPEIEAEIARLNGEAA